jgi:hypothetical protein
MVKAMIAVLGITDTWQSPIIGLFEMIKAEWVCPGVIDKSILHIYAEGAAPALIEVSLVIFVVYLIQRMTRLLVQASSKIAS